MEVAFPLLGWDLTGRGPPGKAEATQGPEGTSSSGSCSEAPVCVLCLLGSSLYHSLERRQCCHGIYHHAACSAWSPTGLSPGSQRQPLGMEAERKAMGAGSTISPSFNPKETRPFLISVPASPSCRLHRTHTHICLFDWPSPVPVLPKGLKWGGRAEKLQK